MGAGPREVDHRLGPTPCVVRPQRTAEAVVHRGVDAEGFGGGGDAEKRDEAVLVAGIDPAVRVELSWTCGLFRVGGLPGQSDDIALVVRDAVAQEPVKGAVRLRQRRRTHAQHLTQSIFPRFLRHARIQPGERGPQPTDEQHLAEGIPFRRRLAGGQIRTMADRVAQFPEPRQGGVFDGGFVETHRGGHLRFAAVWGRGKGPNAGSPSSRPARHKQDSRSWPVGGLF